MDREIYVTTYHYFVPYRWRWSDWSDYWDEPYYDVWG